MLSPIKNAVILCFLVFWGSTAFAYHEEHMGRIVNASREMVTVEYQVCQYQNAELQACEEHIATINALDQVDNFLEFNLDAVYSNKNSKIERIYWQQITMLRVIANGFTTRFRRLDNERNDELEHPLHGACSLQSAINVLILTSYNDKEFYCISG